MRSGYLKGLKRLRTFSSGSFSCRRSKATCYGANDWGSAEQSKRPERPLCKRAFVSPNPINSESLCALCYLIWI